MSVADHEARASESEQRPQKQKGVVAVGEEPEKQDNGEAQKQKRENRPAAELVRQDAERDADGGREKGLHRSQDEHLGGAEIVPLNQKGGERGKHSPNRKTERKRQERYPQNPGVARRPAITSASTTGFSTAFSYKKIYSFAGYFNCRLTALAPTDKAPLPPSHRDGRATPAWRRRCGHTPRNRALRARRSTHRRRPAGRGDLGADNSSAGGIDRPGRNVPGHDLDWIDRRP